MIKSRVDRLVSSPQDHVITEDQFEMARILNKMTDIPEFVDYAKTHPQHAFHIRIHDLTDDFYVESDFRWEER